MSDFLGLVSAFHLAIKARVMYGGVHPRSRDALAGLAGQFTAWLEDRPNLHLAASQGRLFLDGAPAAGKHVHMEALARQFSERRISGIVFRQGLTPEDLWEVLALFTLTPAQVEEAGGGEAILARRQLDHVQLSQTRYQEVRAGEMGEDLGGPGPAGPGAAGTGLDTRAVLAALAAALPASPAAGGPAPDPDGAAGPGAAGSGAAGPGAAGGDGAGAGGIPPAVLAEASQRQEMLAALEAELGARPAPAQLARLRELIAQLQWEDQSTEEKLRLAEERDQLWSLSLDQRLRFLRQLLDERRLDGFMNLLGQLLEALRQGDVARRQMAAWTLNGLTRWLQDPGLPAAAELALLEGLAAHFGWEPLAAIHRAGAEALAVAVAALVARGAPGRALALLETVAGQCAPRDPAWRTAALAELRAGLGAPGSLKAVAELVLTASPETLAEELVSYFRAVGQPSGRVLAAALGSEPERKRRARLLEALRALGPLALPAVYEALEAPAWFLVRNALNLLGEIGDAGSVERVRGCLAHTDPRVKRAAVRALWRLGGAAAAPALLGALPGAEPETQLEIMFALGQIRAAQAVAALAGFALDRRHTEQLRVKAAETIGQIGDPGSVPLLADLARRKGRIFSTAEPLPVRIAACRAMAALGSAQALAALAELVAAEPRGGDRNELQKVLDGHRRP